jgi:putative phosphoesterase
MRLGVLADVHANHPALEAVLEDLPPVDQVVCLGDIVGYNPWPATCVERIRAVADVTVQGNHDRDITSLDQYPDAPRAEAGLRHAFESLSTDQREWLTELPRTATIDDYLFVHRLPTARSAAGAPSAAQASRESLENYAGVVFGHTHTQYQGMNDGRLRLNPGAVGEPPASTPRAKCAILDTDSGAVERHRVGYDAERVRERCRELGFPTRSHDPLGQGI